MTEDNMLTINKIRNEEFNNKSTMIKTLRTLYILMAFALLPAFAAAQGTRYYVALEAAGTGDGSSWGNATTLGDALAKAKANDEIWVMGYNDEGNSKFYFVPKAGYTLKSGVKLYGGFNGTETSSIDEREVIDNKAYRMVYRTVISGDIDKNDALDATNLIFPGNDTRTDNATHVLTLNMTPGQTNINNWETVVDGVTIAGGHAVNGRGGGIFVKGNNNNGGRYILRRCFFIGNYAGEGGALYVVNTVKNVGGTCLIDRCGFFNNAAGQRSGIENAGGAVCLAGAGTIVNTAIFNNENGGVKITAADGAAVVNSTVTRNTGSGIDGKDKTVNNTVIWGNSLLSTSDDAKPAFNHCAYPEANADGQPDDEGNIYLDSRNNEEQGPHFDAPSVKTGFDTDYMPSTTFYPLWTWVPLEGSNLIDKGDNDKYDKYLSSYGNVDLDGNPRQRGTIDIGAFEFQPVSTSRIRYVRQGYTGDGSSWENASGDLQRMIDELAENGDGQPGEVWVAAGRYEPLTQLITGTSYSASFRMRNGVSVYGGFSADNPEASKALRGKGDMPWNFTNETQLVAAYYDHENFKLSGDKWTLTSDSRHVVWFAPLGEDDPGFTIPTYLDGVTVRGGYAQGDTGLEQFKTDRGAGVYMEGENTFLTNCIVKENYAVGNGGGVYVKYGRVQTSLIYNNNSDANGGAVYVDDQGLVHRSMLTNNSARNGAGAYLDNADDATPEYLILSTCVVSNNTTTGNAAVYCNRGGVLLQNTVVNNNCVTGTDLTDPNASQTGGVYVNEYGLVANSVIWNNHMGASSSTNIPMYAKNPTAETVRFLYNAISGVNNSIWNNTRQEQTLSLVDKNAGQDEVSTSIGPRFNPVTGSNMESDDDLETKVGVQSGWDLENGTAVSYYWEPVAGSNLWARGMPIGQLPQEVVLAPEIDIKGGLFAQKPAVGAFHVERSNIVPSFESSGRNYKLVVYIDADCTEPDHHGTTWKEAYRSLNDAIVFCAGLSSGNVTGVYNGAPNTVIPLANIDSLEIRVLEGDLWPRYAFVNEDPKTATLDILKMQSGKPLKIVGGYYRTTDSNTAERDPLNHRSVLNGNSEGGSIKNGLYHVVTVEQGAQVELDGFHIVNGYAAGTATRQYGAGLLAHAGANVTLTDCIFENNTAANGAAIHAADAESLTMRNCVVNNNTNTVNTNSVIVSPSAFTMHHVTIVNNDGAAPGYADGLYATSFAAGNTQGYNLTLKTTGVDGAKNFANPTNGIGAPENVGYDTYLGGYSSFRPLTNVDSQAADLIINKVTATTGLKTDIMGNDRNLGGVPDLGAYEADLPKAGKVIYVRSYNDDWSGDRETKDGTPNMDVETAGDGSSWATAINGNAICDVTKESDFYVKNNDGSLQKSSFDNYESGIYASTSNSYGDFWSAIGNSQKNGYNQISNKREEQYVSGLQYAVEKAAVANADLPEGEDSVVVWVGAGIYTDYKGFVIRDGVKVYGGFPNGGTPGEDDRLALLSGYIPKRKQYADIDETKYETILQVRKENPVSWSNYNEGEAAAGWLPNSTVRHYVLYQPDVCLPTWAPDNDNQNSKKGGNCYRYQQNSYFDNDYYVDYKGASWDGFTVRHGYICNYKVNRDGGAGVRVFRGVTLENLVIVNNYSHGSRSRGGGLYMDGQNSRINNSFIVNNYCSGAESYGGGAYMIVGTGFNMVLANNHSDKCGGGLFIESATFYNNTVVYNRASGQMDSNTGNGSGIYQYADANDRFRPSKLGLYNCIFYGNVGYNNKQIGSNAPNTFEYAYNCYVSGSVSSNIQNKFLNDNTYQNQTGNLSNPFNEGNNAQSQDNYRLSSSSTCVNRGTEILGTDIVIPNTDVDFTNRIKDCTIDIGAYESDNEENIKYEERPSSQGGIEYVYYVTQNGAGIRSGGSVDDAACADKLQQVLTAAGKFVSDNSENNIDVVVKVAGYDQNVNDFVYHANTLANTSDPQSYTYLIPDGVTLEGGYDEDFTTRNVMTYRTVLSAVAVPSQGSTITQEVNGYHAVTFADSLEKGAVVDGVWLVDGSATSMAGAGNANTMGGGAIVPKGAHVRNCVVMDCAAVNGGGLYLMPGGTVSGTVVMNNTADKEGGGIYADNGGTDSGNAANRAHILSCTVGGNTADDGGGLYLEDGAAMSVNSVIWGNDAPQGKNVSGVTGEQFPDDKLAAAYGITAIVNGKPENKTSFYPFNDCFVESQEMPSDFENSSMQSEYEMYFDELYMLKELSPLIKHGMNSDYFDKFVAAFDIAGHDMQGRVRNDENLTYIKRIDAGAFAYPRDILPDDLFKRIFVSQTTNVKLAAGKDMLNYLGRSFYTSFSTLEDALSYIRKMRSTGKADAGTEFEILIAGGTYKPTEMRETKIENLDHDQRLYSFVIPQNVSIYGGFVGNEEISTEGVDSIPLDGGGSQSVTPDEPIADVIGRRHYSDFNGNGIVEPWELEQQTILSGAINASSTAQNAYHVLFSNKEGGSEHGVLLDGLTIMDGETWNRMTTADQHDEAGRGGGLYSDGVPYTLSRCRFQNNFAVRGGAVYVRDARLNIVGSIFAGNGTVDDAATGSEYQPARGGAIFMASSINDSSTSLYAANSLFVNNGTDETLEGGAIATNYADGQAADYAAMLDIINCTFAKNKAKYNGVIYNDNGRSQITNTLMWGNEGEPTDFSGHVPVSHSASDVDYFKAFGDNNAYSNIRLDTGNTGTNGPRFANPSTVAGVDGNDATNLWNPSAISVVTDKGDGIIPLNGNATGGYTDWFNKDENTWLKVKGYEDLYMQNDYDRYSGPLDEETGQTGDRPIDIGFYEYQYYSSFQTLLAIYVATEESGDGTGRDGWENATSDLRGAIVGASHPLTNDGPRTIYVRDGDYSWGKISGGSAFVLNMANGSGLSKSDELTIKGSCTGVGTGDNAQQNYANPTVIRNDQNANQQTERLMLVTTNDNKKVTIDGFTFINSEVGKNGMEASTGNGGSFTLKNSAFRGNGGTGLNISSNSGEVLIYNTLFADGGTGLTAKSGTDKITLVNTTFANNTAADMTGTPTVYNSVSWNNGKANMSETNANDNNKVFKFEDGYITVTDGQGQQLRQTPEENNGDISNGPNFVDPLNDDDIELRDYHIRPSLTLLNKGGNGNYSTHVTGSSDGIPNTEVDLGNNSRLVDGTIDIGAYEYEAPLQPIVYVKAGVVNPEGLDGKSWESALNDLQGAVDLAGIYAATNEGECGYVFVHRNVRPLDNESRNLRLTLADTKVYGGMYDETSPTQIYDENGNLVTENKVETIKTKVGELLDQRDGLIERTSAYRSVLGDVSVSGVSSVVDGFEVNGNVNLGEGSYLSTSIVNVGATLSGRGVLYNSLVYRDVPESIKTVNVTATGAVPTTNVNFNNRGGVTADNKYVDYNEWKYQLNETSADIDPESSDNDETGKCEEMVGHERDIAGNKRIRGKVDNGCFETWNITTGMTADNTVEDDDYPRARSVVYVREGAELTVNRQYTQDVPFNPGVLLLEHQAGLRGGGNSVALSHVIVERNVPKNGVDMAYVPFTVNTFENENNVAVKYYDAAKRAAYDFKFDGDNGTAWTDKTDSYGQTGLLLDNTAEGASDAKVRFIGKANGVYTESADEVKQVTLEKNNFEDPWVGNEGTGKRFTHKENMSWNLFGSPYLCAMKYGDMEYGRVIYGQKDGKYITRNTELAANTGGYIPAGDAVFTQTATLSDTETFGVKQPTARDEGDEPYCRVGDLTLTLTRTGETRADGDAAADELQLAAVPASEARADFDLSADGVKWMAANRPQIYATRGNARYSLLSAVNIEGETAVGVTVPEAGMYTIAVPESCVADGYETVVLEDNVTHKTVDLLEGGYDFTAAAPGDIEGRFTVSFNRMVDDGRNDGIRAYSVQPGVIRVEGVAEGDRISVYSVDGVMAAQRVAASSAEDIAASVAVVAVVKVERDGKTVAVRKLKMKN